MAVVGRREGKKGGGGMLVGSTRWPGGCSTLLPVGLAVGLWQLSADILDPVSVVCSGAAQTLEVLGWFKGGLLGYWCAWRRIGLQGGSTGGGSRAP